MRSGEVSVVAYKNIRNDFGVAAGCLVGAGVYRRSSLFPINIQLMIPNVYDTIF